MKKLLAVILIAIGIVPLNSCDSSQKDNETTVNKMPIDVSILQLFTNPYEYHGKKVRLKGVGNLAFEATSVYLSQEGWYNLTHEKLWLSIPSELIDGEWCYRIGEKLISEENAKEAIP